VRYVEVPVTKPVAGGGLSVKLDAEATLRSRKLVELRDGEKPPRVAPLAAAERKFYLAPGTHADFDAKPFREWLDAKKLRREAAEDPLDFAARVLEVVRADYTYHFDPDEDKRASVVCLGTKTDCGGLSFLFVGAMRANDVPARLLVGRLALPRKPGSNPGQLEYDRPHVRAEVFVAGVGWVPVDPAYALRDKRRPASAFVGDDPGDLLVLHVDADLQLPFPDKVREAQFLQITPYYWTTGKGAFDGTFGPSGWDLKAAPIKK
jgi:transglutaminase-like putative cysteine protease